MFRATHEKLNRWSAVGALFLGSQVAAQVYSGVSTVKAQKETKKATEAAIARQDEAAANLKAEEQAAAAQAEAKVAERRKRVLSGSKSIYTSPLGLAGQAQVAKKTLLGA